MVIFRTSAVADRFCSFRVKGTCILCIPVQFLAGSSHAVIDVSCTRNTLRNVRCVSCDLGSDDTLLGILYIRQSQVFSRCNIAKESSTVHSGNCTSDRCSDMVISRSDISYQRSEYIERCTHADALLYLHICSNLIQRHMARTFYHNLYIVIPCTFGQFSEANQLFNLAYVRCISKAARTASVTKRNGHIIFFTDIQNFIIIFIEWILLAGHGHPCKYEASSTAYDVHFTFVLFDLFDGLACDTAVQRYKVHTVFCMHTDNVDKILCSQCSQISLVMDHAVVNRNSTDHNRTFACQFLTERLCVAMAGKIHDRFRTEVNGTHNLLHFDIVILAVTRYAEVDIDLGTQHAADTLCT